MYSILLSIIYYFRLLAQQLAFFGRPYVLQPSAMTSTPVKQSSLNITREIVNDWERTVQKQKLAWSDWATKWEELVPALCFVTQPTKPTGAGDLWNGEDCWYGNLKFQRWEDRPDGRRYYHFRFLLKFTWKELDEEGDLCSAVTEQHTTEILLASARRKNKSGEAVLDTWWYQEWTETDTSIVAPALLSNEEASSLIRDSVDDYSESAVFTIDTSTRRSNEACTVT